VAATSLDAGLESWEDFRGVDPFSADGRKVCAGIRELIAELLRRGESYAGTVETGGSTP
jgi:hypothetical protein